MATAHALRVTLLGSEPEIWREFHIHSDATLGELHRVLQAVMGWTDSHLHAFRVRRRTYSDPVFELNDAEDEHEATVGSTLPGKGAKLTYEYDFGDGWEHAVEVLGLQEAPAGGPWAVCTGGARACPPEDVGGVYGYQEFLEALRDPKHERHEEFAEWMGLDEEEESDGGLQALFDPEAFDVARANQMIAALARGRQSHWMGG